MKNTIFCKTILTALIFLIPANICFAQQSTPNNTQGEIVVSAVANIKPAKSLVRAHLLIQTEAKSAKVAMGKLDQLERKLLSSTESLNLSTVNSQLSFRSLSKTSPEIKNGVTFVGEKRISFDVKQFELANLIDSAIEGGNVSIESLEIIPPDNFKNTEKAISTAISRVKAKAKKISLEMGVDIGEMISTTVTEESIGAAVMRNRKIGGMAAISSNPSRRVIVQARFRTS